MLPWMLHARCFCRRANDVTKLLLLLKLVLFLLLLLLSWVFLAVGKQRNGAFPPPTGKECGPEYLRLTLDLNVEIKNNKIIK